MWLQYKQPIATAAMEAATHLVLQVLIHAAAMP